MSLLSRIPILKRQLNWEKNILIRKLKMSTYHKEALKLGITTLESFIAKNSKTFDHDKRLRPLPLPKLEDTLERYYKSLLPFGNDKELENSKKIIQDFKNGEGKKLHMILQEKASKEKNWVEDYWENHAYLTVRDPPTPTQAIAQPFMIESVGVELNEENRLKNFARLVHYYGAFWKLIRNEKLRPSTNLDGSLMFSSDQYRRLFNTSKIPGEIQDSIRNVFFTRAENVDCSSIVLILAKGKIFYFNLLLPNEILMSPQEIFYCLSYIDERIKRDAVGDEIPILTCDLRTNWAKNRKYLMEISIKNAQFLEIIESSMMAFSMDDNEPKNLGEISIKSLDGNYSSRWMDKSIIPIIFKNGKIGCIGEHASYDGPVFTGSANFILANFLENHHPDWQKTSENKIVPREMKFDIDEKIKFEIKRVKEMTDSFRGSVDIKHECFSEYGKKIMKMHKIHPDSYVQMALQLAYFRLHKKLAPTYESATMRAYYHGRTETVRSCSIEVKKWIDIMNERDISALEKSKFFREAAKSQLELMNDARNGNGVDRHLFALLCIAKENNITNLPLYEDPLYYKSGGGGNFELSTSTLGYTISLGGMAPMVKDGYGVFYTMLDNRVYIFISTFCASKITCCEKFFESFSLAMNDIRKFLDESSSSEL